MKKMNLPQTWLCFYTLSKVKEICLLEDSCLYSFLPNFFSDYFKHWKSYFNLLSCSTFYKVFSDNFINGLQIVIRDLLIILLTLFQDKFVRIGTLTGILIGIWNPEILQGEQEKNVIILGFVGWGIGAFLGYYRKGDSPFSKNRKFKVFQGGK